MKIGFCRRKNAKRTILYLALTGLLAGFCNGLLGAGGGILIVFSLSRLLESDTVSAPDIFANALCVMIPISVVSCIRYAMVGNLSADGFGIYVLPAVTGGLLGAVLLGKMQSARLKKFFSALVIYSGVWLILR